MWRMSAVSVILILVLHSSLVHNEEACSKDGPGDCDLTDNFCHWKDLNNIWLNTNENGNPAKRLDHGQTGDVESRLVCSTHGSDHCFKLRYKFTQNTVIKLKIKIKTKLKGSKNSKMLKKMSDLNKWEVAEVPVKTDHDFKIIISTMIPNATKQKQETVYIDDLTYDKSPCTGMIGSNDPETSDGKIGLTVGLVAIIAVLLIALIIVAVVFVARRRQQTPRTPVCSDKEADAKHSQGASFFNAGYNSRADQPGYAGSRNSDVIRTRDSSASYHIYSAIDEEQLPSPAGNGLLESSVYSLAKSPSATELAKPAMRVANTQGDEDDPYEIKDLGTPVKQEPGDDDYSRLNIDQRAGGGGPKSSPQFPGYNCLSSRYDPAKPETAGKMYHCLEKEEKEGTERGARTPAHQDRTSVDMSILDKGEEPNSAPVYHVLEKDPTAEDSAYHLSDSIERQGLASNGTPMNQVPKSSEAEKKEQLHSTTTTTTDACHVLENNNETTSVYNVPRSDEYQRELRATDRAATPHDQNTDDLTKAGLSGVPKGQPMATPQKDDDHGHSPALTSSDDDGESYNSLGLTSGKRLQAEVKGRGREGIGHREGNQAEGGGAYDRLGHWAPDAYCLTDRDNTGAKVIDGEYSHLK